MGKPDFTLSGLYGDGYVFKDGSTVVFYFGANELVYDIKKSDEPRKPASLHTSKTGLTLNIG
ncbi:hypothetical protein [Desulfosporosinus sp. OT]|uniref:hypothetical protein n=1 Tax=Desulfosporosinus sp. OT TaxID=913865 RepID=UPI000223A8F2|nr:hypothetical protein [Desulfosporosinus sp. OT]EGW39692.1 hypothetical protein DOT_2307 [Desulfosporosinus sp. OT]